MEMPLAKPISTGKIVGLAILGVLIIFVLWVMATYNSLVNLDENANRSLSDIEVQYQRRFDLIPNLVETAKGIANLEQSVFTKLAEARSKYAGAPAGAAGTNERIAAMNQFDSSLSRLLVIVENYPVLKSAESFLKLQDQLEGTENRVSVARNDYNASATQLNKKLRTFPSNLVASAFSFDRRELFNAVAEASAAPKVEFDFK